MDPETWILSESANRVWYVLTKALYEWRDRKRLLLLLLISLVILYSRNSAPSAIVQHPTVQRGTFLFVRAHFSYSLRTGISQNCCPILFVSFIAWHNAHVQRKAANESRGKPWASPYNIPLAWPRRKVRFTNYADGRLCSPSEFLNGGRGDSL